MKTHTTKGHEVFALQRWVNPKTKAPEWSGKIRMNQDNPGEDEYLKWHREDWRNGIAIKHEMGDLKLEAIANE